MIDTSHLVLCCIKQASSQLVSASIVCMVVCLFIRPSVRLSVRTPARSSVRHLFSWLVGRSVNSLVGGQGGRWIGRSVI